MSSEKINQPLSYIRAAHDALLLADGAKLLIDGRIMVTSPQRRLAELTGNPLHDPLVNEEFIQSEYTQRDEWLDRPLPDAQSGLNINAGLRAVQLLRRHGIITVRDIVVTGQDRITNFRGVGSGILEGLETVIESAPFALDWPELSTAATVSQTCSYLYQVNAQTLSGQSEAVGGRIYCHDFPNKTTVEDILHAGKEGIVRFMTRNKGMLTPDYHPNQAYEDAKVFATEFQMIKMGVL